MFEFFTFAPATQPLRLHTDDEGLSPTSSRASTPVLDSFSPTSSSSNEEYNDKDPWRRPSAIGVNDLSRFLSQHSLGSRHMNGSVRVNHRKRPYRDTTSPCRIMNTRQQHQQKMRKPCSTQQQMNRMASILDGIRTSEDLNLSPYRYPSASPSGPSPLAMSSPSFSNTTRTSRSRASSSSSSHYTNDSASTAFRFAGRSQTPEGLGLRFLGRPYPSPAPSDHGLDEDDKMDRDDANGYGYSPKKTERVHKIKRRSRSRRRID